MIRIGVLISGRGSNLQAILEQSTRGQFAAQVAVVISNVAGAEGLKRAENFKVPHLFVDPKSFPDKVAYEKELVRRFEAAQVDLVCLAGYMKIVGPTLIHAFLNRIMNIHPALLPSFPGLHAQRQALAHGVKVSGVTVHFVDEGMDTGPIILQKSVPVLDEDTEATLSARILAEEHKIYPQAIQLFAEGRLKLEGRVIRILSEQEAASHRL